MKTRVHGLYRPPSQVWLLLTLLVATCNMFSIKNLLRSVITLALLVGMSACGGGASEQSDGGGAASAEAVQAEFAAGVTLPVYPVGGTLSGLQPHQTVVLLNNRTDELTLAADGTFIFPTQLKASATYLITVKTPPPNSTCSTWRYKGVVQAIDPNAKPGTVYPQLSAVVRCRPNVPPEMTIGGILNGLGAGKTMVLANNNTDLLSLASNGPMAFAVKAVAGSAYSVTVKTQPDGQLCTVAGGSGTVVESTSASGGPVPAQETIVVNCSNVAPGYRISGALSGLSGAPALDRLGRVVGVTLAESPRRGRIYTTPPEVTARTLSQGLRRLPASPGSPISVENYGRVADSLRRDLRVAQVVCLSA